MTVLTIMNSLMNNPNVSQYHYYDMKRESQNSIDGVLINEHYHIQCSRQTMAVNPIQAQYQYQLIIADNSTGKKRMGVLFAYSLYSKLFELVCCGKKENVIIDLNREGRRWEGGELNDKPFGFGCEYSENGNLVYEGFVFEGKNVCFGKEWNDDGNNNCLMYEGGYCNGERWGKGKSYDLTGNVDFDGEWMNNHILIETGKERGVMKDLIIPMSIEELVIGDRMLNDKNITTLHLSSPLLLRVKRIEIGSNCFQNVCGFVIDGLKRLESVKIGEDCFRINNTWFGRFVLNEREIGIFQISNCPNLSELGIGDYSFYSFKLFKLFNVNSLKSINFGEYCFRNANLSLKGM